MSRSRTPLLAVPAAVLAVGLLAPAPASAAGETLNGLVLTGICPGQVGDLKSVVTAPKNDNIWAPLQLLAPDTFQPIRKSLHPYQITVVGNGLKARHLGPGTSLTKPGKAPKQSITCEFDGATKDEGAFQVIITGSVKPDPRARRCDH